MRPHAALTRAHTRAATAAALLLAAATAHAEIVDIAWGAEGRFERRLQVVPGKFAELCGKLQQGQSVRWRFESAQPLNFNIHYHVGKDVVYPVQQNATAKAEGQLAVALDQDYCWMWTNKSGQPATLLVTLAR